MAALVTRGAGFPVSHVCERLLKGDAIPWQTSRAMVFIYSPLRVGARIRAYDPVAMKNFKRLFPHVE